MTYNPKLRIALQTDASDFAMGAVLTHILKVNNKLIEKTVCYTSNCTPPKRKNSGTGHRIRPTNVERKIIPTRNRPLSAK